MSKKKTPQKQESVKKSEGPITPTNKKWEIGDILTIKDDVRIFTFVEKVEKGVWVRNYLPGNPSGLKLVPFEDIVL